MRPCFLESPCIANRRWHTSQLRERCLTFTSPSCGYESFLVWRNEPLSAKPWREPRTFRAHWLGRLIENSVPRIWQQRSFSLKFSCSRLASWPFRSSRRPRFPDDSLRGFDFVFSSSCLIVSPVFNDEPISAGFSFNLPSPMRQREENSLELRFILEKPSVDRSFPSFLFAGTIDPAGLCFDLGFWWCWWWGVCCLA